MDIINEGCESPRFKLQGKNKLHSLKKKIHLQKYVLPSRVIRCLVTFCLQTLDHFRFFGEIGHFLG
jgi:hypothetical protein